MSNPLLPAAYRGRLAPSPTGYLHTGHARTFWTAQQRAERAGGVLVLRNEDLDAKRSRPEFAAAMLEDLRWFGFHWQEGPDCGGPYGPYVQSASGRVYKAAFAKLRHGRLDLSLSLFASGCHAARCRRRTLERKNRFTPGTCRPKARYE